MKNRKILTHACAILLMLGTFHSVMAEEGKSITYEIRDYGETYDFVVAPQSHTHGIKQFAVQEGKGIPIDMAAEAAHTGELVEYPGLNDFQVHFFSTIVTTPIMELAYDPQSQNVTVSQKTVVTNTRNFLSLSLVTMVSLLVIPMTSLYSTVKDPDPDTIEMARWGQDLILHLILASLLILISSMVSMQTFKFLYLPTYIFGFCLGLYLRKKKTKKLQKQYDEKRSRKENPTTDDGLPKMNPV